MTVQGRNEAAVRLREFASGIGFEAGGDQAAAKLDDLILETLAAERRATVERIREAVNEAVNPHGDCDWANEAVLAILDEEAAS